MAEGTFNRVRTFSSSNHHASTEIHRYIASQQNPRVREVNLAREVTKSSMIIPTFSKFKSHNRHLARYTLGLTADANSLAVLEQDNIINWCPHARTLIPLNTDSDGNCLLHAVSMYIWGVHDRRLTLRNFLHQKLQMALKGGELYNRWKYAQEGPLHDIQTSFPSFEMRRDWESIIDSASSVEFPMGNRGQKYSPLEDIHIFTMSNILARPIVILSERIHHGPNGASLQPNQISGIYLPLLRGPYDCERSPVVIGYLSGHFVPLLSGEDFDLLITKRAVHPDAQHCIPLVYSDLTDIPVRFMLQNEGRISLLNKYMDCFSMPILSKVKEAVILKFKSPPAWSVELMFSLYTKAQETYLEYAPSAPWVDQAAASVAATVPTAVFDRTHRFRDEIPQRTEQTNRQVYSQVSSTISSQLLDKDVTMTVSGSNSERKPCILVYSGCKNFGEERYHKFCRECYNTYYFSSRTDDKERSDIVPQIQRPSTSSSLREGITIPEPPGAVSSKEPGTSKCLIQRCFNQGKPEFRDMCEGCFRERMNMPTGLAINESSPSSTSAVIGKVFCADPGCQEEIVQGTDRCENHLYKKTDCITENCDNKAVDNEIPLCSDCRKKNFEAEAQLRKVPSVTKAPFCVPNTYPAFTKVEQPIRKVEVPQGVYNQPQWQSGLKAQKPPTGPPYCVERLCSNFAAPEKGGRCNECYNLKMQFRASEMESWRNDMPLGSPNYGQYIEEERRPVTGSNVSAAVRSQIDSQLRRAAEGDVSSIAHHNPPRNDSWDHDSQRYIGARRNSDRQVQNESGRSYEDRHIYGNQGVYENERNLGAQRNYESQRDYDYENIYEEIPDPLVGSGTQAARRPSNDPIVPGRPVDLPRMQSGFVNEGYQPGIYSVMKERRQTRGRCEKCGRDGVAVLSGICDICHTELMRKEEEEEVDRLKAQKLPYLKPIPCKTHGCPRFAEVSSGDLCEECLARQRRNPPGSVTVSSSSAAYPGYDGGIDTGRRATSQAAGRQPAVCATPSCGFYASGEYGPFCSKCFMEKTKLDAGNSAQRDDPMTSSSSDNQRWQQLGRGSISDTRPCRREGCELFGILERNGYCSQCYELFY